MSHHPMAKKNKSNDELSSASLGEGNLDLLLLEANEEEREDQFLPSATEEEEILTGIKAAGLIKGSQNLAPYSIAIGLATRYYDQAKEAVASQEHYLFSWLLNLMRSKLPEYLEYEVVSIAGVDGAFVFSSVPDEEVFRFLVKSYKENIEEVLLGRVAEGMEVQFLESDWDAWAKKVVPEAPNSFLGFISLYSLAEFARGLFGSVDYLRLLGLEARPKEGSDYQEYLLETSANSLPGFSTKLGVFYSTRGGVFSPDMGVSSFPVMRVAPAPLKIVFSSFFYLSILDYLFGYSALSRQAQGRPPLARALQREDLDRYLEQRSKLDESIDQVLPFISNSLADLTRTYPTLPPEEKTTLLHQFRTLFQPVSVFLSQVLYGNQDSSEGGSSSEKNLPDIDKSLASLFLTLAASSTQSEDGGSLISKVFKGKTKVSTKEAVMQTLKRVAKEVSSIFRKRGILILSDISRNISSSRSVFDRPDKARNFSKHFESVLLDTAHILRSRKGVASFRLTYSDMGTAHAAVYPTKDGKAIAEVNLNLEFLIALAISSGLNWMAVFSAILYHEFLHLYFYHVHPEMASKGKSPASIEHFSVQSFLEPERIARLHKDIRSLVPTGISNIHTDAFINQMALKVAEAVSDTLNPRSFLLQRDRLRNVFDSSFFIGDQARPVPNAIVLTDYSRSRTGGHFVSPLDKDYRAKVMGRIHKLSFILPNAVFLGTGNREDALSSFFSPPPTSSYRVSSLPSILSLLVVLVSEALGAKGGTNGR